MRWHRRSKCPFSEHDDTEITNKINSPLKVSTELGNKIKKLSPVTGASESSDAKEAFERLLKEASMSMFVDDEDCDVKMSPEGENEVDVACPVGDPLPLRRVD